MRRCPSCLGETTLRSSHHCSCRKLTPATSATSLDEYVRSWIWASGRLFLALNIMGYFRFVNFPRPFDCTRLGDSVNRASGGWSWAETSVRSPSFGCGSTVSIASMDHPHDPNRLLWFVPENNSPVADAKPIRTAEIPQPFHIPRTRLGVTTNGTVNPLRYDTIHGA